MQLLGILGRMNKYDLTVLIKSDVKDEAKEEFVKKVEKLTKILGGTLGKMTEMGRKQLAYPIQKLTEAQYLVWVLELPGAGVVELEKKLHNDKEVLRHLLVRI